MALRKLQVGVAGLGRMGKRHALNFFQSVPRAELVAVSSPGAEEREWASKTLGPSGVTVYESYDAMLQHKGLDAVCVASATTVHASQAIKAIEAGKNVLCEKPLATTAKVMSRGDIGRPSVFRSQTCDMLDPSGFLVAYAELSGGIFVDCSIHDVDLALWFFHEEDDAKVRSVSAVGITAVEPGLCRYGDRDNAMGLVEFADGRIAHLYSSRMMAAGQDDATEIIGTRGKLSVNSLPAANLVRVYEAGGMRQEVPQNYWDRFRNAFAREAVEFTDCCLDDTEVPVKLTTAVAAVRIAAALQQSMITGEKIWFNQLGQQAIKAQL
ncbi:hypothetical protein MY3296_008051 [Beauveria thailandica]